MRYILLLTLLCLSGVLNAQSGKRPNIIIIVSDDHAFQAISAYGGNLMQTPGIDRLAREGAIFNHAYVTNSICGPSRAVILTGKYSHKNGFKDNRSRFDAGQDQFAKRLRSAGYQTAWIGKWHLKSKPEGFDFWQILPGQGDYYNPDFLTMDGKTVHKEGYVTNLITDDAEQWMSGRDTSRPFCLVIGHKATHRTWIPDTADLGLYDGRTFPLPANFYDDYEGRYAAAHQDMNIAHTMRLGYDLKMTPDTGFGRSGYIRLNPAQRAKFDAYYKPIAADLAARKLSGKELTEWKYQRYMKDYLATAASLDRNIARVLNYLDAHHLSENTMVIYLSDQGFYMGEHGWFDKRFMYEESFRTPMVARYPGVLKPGSVINGLVMNLDIAPTCLDAAGVAIPAAVQGRSFLPLLKQPDARWRKSLYYHYYERGEHSVIPHFGVRTERYKLIRFYNGADKWELFDLQQDPSEMKNLYGRKGYEKITAGLKKELVRLIKEYDDEDALKLVKQ
ncbi:sulfatase family protein [Chitinophaga alhagiae]|uniref:sulfatase family protein n=1 Tax=Chitinophaga alhagiae TaxID=2203219 RepID=UPI0018E586FB|nr:sulfatase [Chitinophaga alhagiae]